MFSKEAGVRNPRVIVFSCIAIFTAAFFIDKAPAEVRAVANKVHLDKFFHAAAGCTLMAFGMTFLGIRAHDILFLWVFTVGAGWEVIQHLFHRWGAELHQESVGLGAYEFYADLAADMIGVLIYWVLHLASE